MNEKELDEKRSGGYRSLFWPIVLIGIGVIALLGTAGVFSRENFVVLFRLWPILLILIGIDLLFGRRAPVVGALIGIGAVALVVFLMSIGPSMGWGGDWEVKTDIFAEPIGEASSATVNLDLSSAPTEIMALTDSPNVIEAELTYAGEIEFSVSGSREKSISLSHSGSSDGWWFDWFDEGEDEQRWEIGLSPRVPLALTVDAGSGPVTIGVAELALTELVLDVGSGPANAYLSNKGGRYTVRVDGGSGPTGLGIPDRATIDLEIDVGSGSFNVSIADDADVTMRVEGGSGRLTVDVPDDAAVRVDVREGGSGSVRVPSRFERTRRGDDDEGTWETPGFATAEHKVEIILEDVGSGDVDVREQ